MSELDKKFQSPLGRAKGLGSAHEGVHHWMAERVSSVLLLPFTFWIVYSIVSLRGAAYPDVIFWLSHPWNALGVVFFIIIGFYHTILGLQVVIEDYVATNVTKLILIYAMKCAFIVMGAVCVFSVLKVAV